MISADVDMEVGIKRQHSSSPGNKKVKRKKKEEKSEIEMFQDKFNEYKKEVEQKYKVLVQENKKLKSEIKKFQVEEALFKSKKETHKEAIALDIGDETDTIEVSSEENVVDINIPVDKRRRRR